MIEVVSLSVTAVSVLFGIYTYYQDYSRKKKIDTLEAYQLLQKTVLDPINKWLPSKIRSATEDKTSDDYKTLSGYLAEIERFCIGVNKGIYDLKMD